MLSVELRVIVLPFEHLPAAYLVVVQFNSVTVLYGYINPLATPCRVGVRKATSGGLILTSCKAADDGRTL